MGHSDAPSFCACNSRFLSPKVSKFPQQRLVSNLKVLYRIGMKSRYLILTSLVSLSLLAPLNANAGVLGTKCSNSGATIKSSGTNYICKNVGGKLKWQKSPIVRSQAAYNNCLLTYNGGWNNANDAQTNLNITNYCRTTYAP